MNFLLVLSLWAAGFCIAFSIANFYWPHLRYDANGQTNGRQRDSHIPSKSPLSVGFLFAAVMADKEKKIPKIRVPRCRKTRRAGAFEQYTLENYQ
ncbi:cytochrome P450 52A6 [Fusarium mexicanum]|uniref:Cytochrome P450 52A6 n=1 Tax=Fusarium mexicanum TaxID=751941 RepID=A0A8H5JGB8_9HYPO|nr:cytochrome P450 52A6 [Fusarium mexicanum]